MQGKFNKVSILLVGTSFRDFYEFLDFLGTLFFDILVVLLDVFGTLHFDIPVVFLDFLDALLLDNLF